MCVRLRVWVLLIFSLDENIAHYFLLQYTQGTWKAESILLGSMKSLMGKRNKQIITSTKTNNYAENRNILKKVFPQYVTLEDTTLTHSRVLTIFWAPQFESIAWKCILDQRKPWILKEKNGKESFNPKWRLISAEYSRQYFHWLASRLDSEEAYWKKNCKMYEADGGEKKWWKQWKERKIKITESRKRRRHFFQERKEKNKFRKGIKEL